MKRTIKILYPIGTYYPSQEGGPSNSVYWMCCGLQQHQDIETTVVTTSRGIDLKDINLDFWYKQKNNRVIYTNSYGHFPFRMLKQTIPLIKKVDILHLTSLFYLPSIIILLINYLFFKKKVVVSVRGELDDYALKNYKPRLKKIILVLWKFFKNKVVFHCTVNEEKEFTYKAFEQNVKTIVLPNFILFNDNKKQKVTKQDYLLFLGRIHPKKGIENLLRAISISETFANSGYKLKVAGKGEVNYESSLKDLVKELNLSNKVEFLGHIEGEEKTELLKAAYFLVFPSYTENFGNVVVEALINETPVIASKGTPWEIIKENNCGYWVENDIQSLANAVDTGLKVSKDNYIKMSTNALNLANTEFNIYNNSYKWNDFYEALIKKN